MLRAFADVESKRLTGRKLALIGGSLVAWGIHQGTAAYLSERTVIYLFG
jgi:hypothetical protein